VIRAGAPRDVPVYFPAFAGTKLYCLVTEKVIHGLSNRAIFNDLEQPQTHISMSRHSLTQNISEMAKDTAIVTIEGK